MKKKNILKGYVLKKKMDKTLVVSVLRIKKNKKYGKYLKKKIKLQVHYDKDVCNINDFIEIKESRPISKKKC